MARVKLGDVAREYKETIQDVSGLPIVALEHLTPCEIALEQWDEDVKTTFSKGFRKGHVLFGRRRAYLKKAAVAPFDGVCSGDITVIEALPEMIRPELLPYIIQNDLLFDFAMEKSAGGLSPRVKWVDLKEFEFTLPTLLEQDALVDILSNAYNTKKAYQTLIRKIDKLVKSQFIEIFGNPDTNTNGHQIRKLAKLGYLNRGVSKARPRNKPELLGGTYPLIQTGEVTAAELFITTYENTYTELGLAQSKMWPTGTLCITIAANIAQTAILGFDACFPDSICGFISKGEVKQVYMYYWFSFFQKILEEQAPQVAQRNINLKILCDLDVMVPPLDLQNKFEQIVAQSDKSKFELINAIDKINAMMKSLINKDNN